MTMVFYVLTVSVKSFTIVRHIDSFIISIWEHRSLARERGTFAKNKSYTKSFLLSLREDVCPKEFHSGDKIIINGRG